MRKLLVLLRESLTWILAPTRVIPASTSITLISYPRIIPASHNAILASYNVIPAKAGIHTALFWMPAHRPGMTFGIVNRILLFFVILLSFSNSYANSALEAFNKKMGDVLYTKDLDERNPSKFLEKLGLELNRTKIEQAAEKSKLEALDLELEKTKDTQKIQQLNSEKSALQSQDKEMNLTEKQLSSTVNSLNRLIANDSGVMPGTRAAPAAVVGDTLDTIIDILSNLTCETQGVGNLLRSEFSHTCIPAPFFTFALMNLVSPVLYMNTFLRLKINDDELFGDDFPGGQCTRENRANSASYIDPNGAKPELTFGLCSNAKLAIARATAVAESAIAIAKAVLTGDDPWDDIKDAWDNKKKDYHNIYKGVPGTSGTMFDIGFPYIPWKIIQDNDRICVSTPGFTGYVPVGCKYIKEPYPESIYSSFMMVSNNPPAATDPLALVDCAADGGCYRRAYNSSKAAIVITAPLIECIREMTARLLISRDVCTFDNVEGIMTAAKKETSALFQFQRRIHQVVTAFLTLYVMLFGLKLILSGNIPQRNEVINFVLKILFVVYFSVGINISPGNSSSTTRLDGMTQFAFPFLLNGINTLAGWMMNASPSELCKFNAPDIHYNPSMGYLSLWDALDCRVSHYLGLDILSTLLVENMSRNHDFTKFDFFSFSAPPYMYLLIPAIYSGNMTLVSLVLAYPLLVISVAAFMVNATVMCMISIVILGILAPLFVPMFLFQYTRGYFESWVKLLISFLLQPMVIVTFMITMFAVYDFGFYGHCKYLPKVLPNSVENAIQDRGSSSREVVIFYVDNEWSHYTEEEKKSCQNSLGYMLNNPVAATYNLASDTLSGMVTNKPGSGSTDAFLSKFDFLGSISLDPGILFTFTKVIFEKVRDIALALITACFTLYLMYHFSSQLANFAADMTEGVALSNVAIDPQLIFKAGMAAMAGIGKAAGGLDKLASGGDMVDRVSSGGGVRDRFDSGGGADKFESGGGVENDDSIVSGGGSAYSTSAPSSFETSALPSATRSGIEDNVTTETQQTEVSPPPTREVAPEMEVRETSRTDEPGRFERLSTELKTDQISTTEPPEDLGAKGRKIYGLQDGPELEQESHEKQIGETGYVAQERRNAEVRDRNAAALKAWDELLRSGGGRAGPGSEGDAGTTPDQGGGAQNQQTNPNTATEKTRKELRRGSGGRAGPNNTNVDGGSDDN